MNEVREEREEATSGWAERARAALENVLAGAMEEAARIRAAAMESARNRALELEREHEARIRAEQEERVRQVLEAAEAASQALLEEARRLAEEVQAEAREEAARTLAQARQEAESILEGARARAEEEARAELEKVSEEVELARSRLEQLQREADALARVHRRLVEAVRRAQAVLAPALETLASEPALASFGGEEAAAAESRPVASGGGEAAMPKPGGEEAPAVEGEASPVGSLATDPLSLREAGLQAIREEMLRRVVKALQGEEELYLSSFRAGASGMLALRGALERVKDALAGGFYFGFSVGSTDARYLAGEAGEGEPARSGVVDAEEVALGAAAAFVGEVGTAVQRASTEGELVEAFSRLRTEWAPRFAEGAAVRAYSAGVLAGAAARGLSVVWVLADEDDCPGESCRANAAAGSVIPGASFPSGHDSPPAHPGCRCSVVPVPAALRASG